MPTSFLAVRAALRWAGPLHIPIVVAQEHTGHHAARAVLRFFALHQLTASKLGDILNRFSDR